MPITPVSALFAVKIVQNNTVTLVDHAQLFWVRAQTDVSDPSGYDLGTGALAVPATTAIATFAGLMQAILTTATTITYWTLYQYVVPNLIPIYTASLGLAGTAGGTLQRAHISTYTFRTLAGYELFKSQIAEGHNTGLFRDNAPGGADLAYANDLKNFSVGHSGAWVAARNNTHPNSFVRHTGSYSRRLRKKYNLL